MQRTFLIGSFLCSFCFLIAGFGQQHSFGGAGGGLGQNPGLPPVGSVGRAPIVPPFGRTLPNPGGSGYGHGSRGRNGGYGYGIGAYPVYIGGFSGDYYPGYTDPSLAGPQYQPAPPPPPVVINQYFGAPPSGLPPEESDVQVYSQPAPSAQAAAPIAPAEPRTYLIAYKDHSVYSALAYWVEDHTLHYVTTQNTHNQADVNLIDVDLHLRNYAEHP